MHPPTALPCSIFMFHLYNREILQNNGQTSLLSNYDSTMVLEERSRRTRIPSSAHTMTAEPSQP